MKKYKHFFSVGRACHDESTKGLGDSVPTATVAWFPTVSKDVESFPLGADHWIIKSGIYSKPTQKTVLKELLSKPGKTNFRQYWSISCDSQVLAPIWLFSNISKVRSGLYITNFKIVKTSTRFLVGESRESNGNRVSLFCPIFYRNPLLPTVSEEKSLEGKIQFHVTIPYCEAKTCVAIEGYFNGKNIERF